MIQSKASSIKLYLDGHCSRLGESGELALANRHALHWQSFIEKCMLTLGLCTYDVLLYHNPKCETYWPPATPTCPCLGL